MRVLFAVVVVAGFAIDCRLGHGAESPGVDRLAAAKESHEKEESQFRDDVVKVLKSAEDAARRAGKKEQLDRIKLETDEFEAKGTLPKSVVTRDAQRRIRKQREELEDVYLATIKSLTKAGQDDDAANIEKELGEFRSQAGIFRGKHFAVFRKPASIDEAATWCEKQGGHLATVSSAEEDAFILSLLKREGVDLAYIGASDAKKEGTWLWTDGRRVAYSNWDRVEGQPNNRGWKGEPEHWSGIRVSKGGKWWDLPPVWEGIDGCVCQWD